MRDCRILRSPLVTVDLIDSKKFQVEPSSPRVSRDAPVKKPKLPPILDNKVSKVSVGDS